MNDEDKYRLDDFELYQLARQFRQHVYQLIKQLPLQERYCLDQQMRKAIVSVTNNIAEGHGRWQYKENMRFCRIASFLVPRSGEGQPRKSLTTSTSLLMRAMVREKTTNNSREKATI